MYTLFILLNRPRVFYETIRVQCTAGIIKTGVNERDFRVQTPWKIVIVQMTLGLKEIVKYYQTVYMSLQSTDVSSDV